MNAISVNTLFEAMDDDADFRSYQPIQRKQRRPEPRRKNGGGGGGMHCRRNKAHTWGSGAAARMADLRAFAGAIAALCVLAVSSASADQFTIGGAAPSDVGGFTGLGQVMRSVQADAASDLHAPGEGREWIDSSTLVDMYDDRAPAASEAAEPMTASDLAAASEALPSQWPVATATVVPTASTVAASGTDVPQMFGDFVNTYSTYGVWDSLAVTDTTAAPVSNDWMAFDSGWNPAAATSVRGGEFLLPNLRDADGRSATVVAVPEPSNMIAASMALGGLIALHLTRRRKMAHLRVAC